MPNYHVVRLSESMETYRLLKKVARKLSPDEYGRRVPDYAVVHRALAEMLERLERKENGK